MSGEESVERQMATLMAEDAATPFARLVAVFYDVAAQSRTAPDRNAMEYWQGKKDGLRIALTLFAPNERERGMWQLLNDSAHNQRATDMEQRRELIADGIRICELLAYGPYDEMESDAAEFIEWAQRIGITK